MEKTAAESHRILVEVYGEHALSERTYQVVCTIQVGMLAWMTKNALRIEKSLKMKNWKHNSMKIVSKHKKSSQNLRETLKQPFQNV